MNYERGHAAEKKEREEEKYSAASLQRVGWGGVGWRGGGGTGDT